MKHRRAHDRAQTQLLPETVEDYVGPEHPVRFLDAFVAQLDLHALGFAKAIPAHTGRPAYDPGDLLRLYLYGQRLRSSRALERESHRNLELRWLLRGQTPDHKTIADFRRDHRAAFKLVHRQFHLLGHELGLLGGELIAVDGTKLAGVNSRDRNFNEKKLGELLARADARLAEYTAALDAADASESAAPAAPALTRAQLEEKIAALQDKQAWHQELLERLQKEELKQLCTTDADARKMPGRHGRVVGYNCQSAVDAKHKLIVAATVTNDVTDLRQLATVARAAQETLQVERLEVVADKGCYNHAEVSACAEEGLTAYMAKPATSANAARGLYTKADFTYDPERDEYRCPAGTALTHRFNTYEQGRALRYYRARGCQQCPLKEKCPRNQRDRTITREEDEVLMEAMAQRVQAQPDKLRSRKGLVEHPFGTIKQWFGYTYFLMKGLENVRGEWSLMTLAYNWKRVLKLVSVPELLVAVRRVA